MPPYPGIPYGAAPAWYFHFSEGCMYVLFLLCLIHAAKRGGLAAGYLVGGVVFGLLLEYINVMANFGYTYGRFAVMFGNPPRDIPLCIGLGWGVIIYTARLFSDHFSLPLWAAAALDALLAISIDLSMDTVAYRLHMWHWNWEGTGKDPLTADWFGVPFGNFFGWLCVVFLYSSIFRLLERRWKDRLSSPGFLQVLIPFLSVLISQVILFLTLKYLSDFLKAQWGINSMHRFMFFLVLLFGLFLKGWGKRTHPGSSLPFLSALIPLWFHIWFFMLFLIAGFYREQSWMTVASAGSLLLGLGVHLWFSRFKRGATSKVSGFPGSSFSSSALPPAK